MHVFESFEFMQDICTVLNVGGHVVLSAPFHGYAKNLIFSIFNWRDKLFKAMENGGHVNY